MRTTKRIFAALGLACVALVAHAAGALQPVPAPDTAKLAPAVAKKMADERAVIDKAKVDLVGPPLAQAYADIGALYARHGFDEAAAVAFHDATQIDPDDARWYYLGGVLARKLKRDDAARADFQAALDRDKVYLPIRYRLADTLVALGDLAGARKVLDEAARDHADQPVVFAMLGQLALKQKQYADAVNALNKALKLDPQATRLYAYLGDAYAGQNNAKAAAEARAKAGDGAPTLADPLLAGMLAPPQDVGDTLTEAQAFAREGRMQAARDTLAVVLKKTPDDAEALALSARIEAALGNQAVAQSYVDQALKAKPDSAPVHLASGIVAEHRGDDARAYDEYRRAQKIDARQPDAWLLLGNAEMRRTRFAQAAEQYRGLVALQPDNAVAYAHLVAALFAQGKCTEAVSTLGAAMAKYKDNGDLAQVYVRATSTCREADAKSRDTALEYGRALYKTRPDAGNSAALALALAAHGKFKEAQEYQAQAIFEVVGARNAEAAALLRSTMQQFDKQQVPDRPWPVEHPYFTAPLLGAVRAAAPTPAPVKK
ncbi:MAG: tetratricopeptide repeat protein [Proteobacteria bacterium]|nr:tetratricopeptide repeat protein [Pseudomonadota bacterium]